MAHFDIGNRLSIYGWKQDETVYFDIMAKIWWEEFEPRFRNIEQLLFHPSKGSLPYIARVRKETRLEEVAEEEILQTLSNLRKNQYLKK